LIQDKVLLDDWIVVCPSSKVQNAPQQVIVMGERLVVFRNYSGIHIFKDLCIHRGAALSLGEVRNNCLVCPYHAWEFNEEGTCVKIPQLPEDASIPTKARAIVYNAKEAYGFIWVNLSGNNPNFFVYKPMESPVYHNIIWGPQSVQAKPPRIIENFLDVGHLAVVHQGKLGDISRQKIDNYFVHQDSTRIFSDEIAIYQPDPDGAGIPKYVYYTYEIIRPLTVLFTKKDKEEAKNMSIILTIRPETEETSVAYGIISFDYDTNLTDEEVIKFQDIIFSEDKPIVENQKPEELPLDLQVELSLVSDRMSIAYRQYLKALGVTLGTN